MFARGGFGKEFWSGEEPEKNLQISKIPVFPFDTDVHELSKSPRINSFLFGTSQLLSRFEKCTYVNMTLWWHVTTVTKARVTMSSYRLVHSMHSHQFLPDNSIKHIMMQTSLKMSHEWRKNNVMSKV